MSSGLSKAQKRLVRELQALRGCNYTSALMELREVGTVSWRAYIDQVKTNLDANRAALNDLDRS